MKVWEYHQYLQAEGLKQAAEAALGVAGTRYLGQKALEFYASSGRGRVIDDALKTEIAGIELENPLIVGAGWDKKGRAVHGLYHLGFAATEVGTVLPEPQSGNPRPRLFMLDGEHSVALNRLGFNSPGAYAVDKTLASPRNYPLPGKLGINIGRNFWTPNSAAADSNARVIRQLGTLANYFVLNLSSPNTKELRQLQDEKYLEELIQKAREAMPVPVPLFIKIDGDRSDVDIISGIAAAAEHGIDGVIAINTTNNKQWIASYGRKWQWQEGGLSGNDWRFRQRSNHVIRILYEEFGDRLSIIGSGGVHGARDAIDKMCFGASAVQVVTGIRSSKGRIAEETKRAMLRQLKYMSTASIRDLIGIHTRRGPAV